MSDGTHFEYRDGELVVEEVFYDEYVQLPTQTRTGYTFGGWYNGDTKIESGIWNYTTDMTLTALWTANTYTVTYDANGGECGTSSEDIVFDESYTVPTPTRTGYTFEGWFVGEKEYAGGTWQTASDTTLVAKWTPRTDITYVVNHHKQNITGDSYELYETQNLTGTADASVTPDVNTYEGFTSPDAQTVTIAPDGSLVVDYYYTRNSYTVTMVTNGGEEIESITQKYQSALTMPDAVRDGYTFGGWFTDVSLTTEFTETTMPLNGTTVYAWWTEENKASDFTYSGTSAITINSYVGTSTTMWIPSYIGGVPVTTIPASAFEKQAELVQVIVPDTVTSIGLGAFKGCVSIEDITLPFVGSSTKATYYNAVFGYIFGYETVDGYKSSNPIGKYTSNKIYTFENRIVSKTTTNICQYSCYAGTYYSDSYGNQYYSLLSYYYYIPTTIKNVTITAQTDIPVAAFNNCDFIESITLPTDVTSIGEYAFQNCGALKQLNSTTDGVFNIPTTVTAIGEYTFYGCTELTTLTLGSNVTSIGKYAFAGCSLLSKFNSENENELIIPSKVKTIGEYAFKNVALVTKIVVADSVTSISSNAFSGCVAVESITVPFVGNNIDSTSTFATIFGSVPTTLRDITITADTTIPPSAFSGLSNVENITIPNNTTTIGSNAFQNCGALKRLNSTTDGTFNIPEGVEVINSYAFQNCTELTTLTHVSDVTSIGDYAFAGCSLLSKFNSENENELIIPSKVETIGSYAFQNVALVTKVVVSDTVTSIGLGAFKGCVSIEDIALPFVGSSTKATYYNAVFGYIFGYETVDGYKSSNPIGKYTSNKIYTFENRIVSKTTTNICQYSCYAGTKYSGSYGNEYYSLLSYYYYIPTTIKNVTITVQIDIPLAAFNNCDFIETINLPKTVETHGSVGEYAFQNCTATVNYNIVPTASVVWNGSKVATSYNSGTGTEADPYVIFDGSQLKRFINQINAGETYAGKYFVIGSNINMGGYTLPMISPTEETAFAGTLDGNGFAVSNFKVSASGTVNGLFGYLNGSLKNLKIESYTFSVTVESRTITYMGALVGHVMEGAVVENCSVSGTATITVTGSANAFASGFIGLNEGTVSSCASNVATTVTGDYTVYVGGFVAKNDGNISDSCSTVKVVGTSNNFMAYVGGFVGQNNGTIQGAFASGNVTAKGSSESYSRNGGFVAENKGTLEECYRASEQVLTKYTTAGNSYNDLATVLPLADIEELFK